MDSLGFASLITKQELLSELTAQLFVQKMEEQRGLPNQAIQHGGCMELASPIVILVQLLEIPV